MNIDRRKLQRFTLTVRLCITNPKTGDSADFLSRNISATGVFVKTDRFYGHQDNLSIEVHLPAGANARSNIRHNVSVKGDVIRQEADGFAIHFHKKFRLK